MTGYRNVVRRAHIQSKVTDPLRPHCCTAREKRFQNIARYDERCNSDSHHQTIRFEGVRSNKRSKADSQGVIEAEKERKKAGRVVEGAGVNSPPLPRSSARPAPPRARSVTNSRYRTRAPPVGDQGRVYRRRLVTDNSSSSGGGFKKAMNYRPRTR